VVSEQYEHPLARRGVRGGAARIRFAYSLLVRALIRRTDGTRPSAGADRLDVKGNLSLVIYAAAIRSRS
jgi:hypothetical protein